MAGAARERTWNDHSRRQRPDLPSAGYHTIPGGRTVVAGPEDPLPDLVLANILGVRVVKDNEQVVGWLTNSPCVTRLNPRYPTEEESLAERVMLVCDVCGKPAAETVSLRAGGRSLQKDVCEAHLSELMNGARQARRGRPKGSSSKRVVARPPRKKTASRRRRAGARKSPTKS